jgi:hypothetical protein
VPATLLPQLAAAGQRAAAAEAAAGGSGGAPRPAHPQSPRGARGGGGGGGAAPFRLGDTVVVGAHHRTRGTIK